ncbi:UNVERIFIED_CONTAM: hypothetical protein Slati_0839800 [Sesamum latifolium]|uniref:RNase H type-1 domain-containing protein n=1 Tax=Sesamum latifolium TaxID=2727402 RepID=A0AAW2XRS2_9LAMI
MVLTLVITERKLRPYFLSNPVGVRTNTPLKQVLGKLEASGRLVKWAIEISENNQERGYRSETLVTSRRWLIHYTREWSVVLTTPQGDDMEFAVKFEFKASNNEAEYEALILGMRMAQDAGAMHLLAYSDSQLIVKQVNGEYKAKEESMTQYLQQYRGVKNQVQKLPTTTNS